MDDSNDIIADPCLPNVLQTVARNESKLIYQCQRIGLCINPDKTEYINFNIPDSALLNSGMKPTKNSKILGAPFSALYLYCILTTVY